YPFEELVENIDINRDAGRNPLFDVIFSLMDAETNFQDPLGKENNEIKQILPEFRKSTAKFDLSLDVRVGEKLSFSVEYCTALFKKETIQRFIGYFKEVVLAITENMEINIADIEILSGEEKKQLLVGFNNTMSDYPTDKTFHELFEDQVEQAPESLAVIHRSRSLSYADLNRTADRLAHLLRTNGAVPNSLIPIFCKRSIETAVAILGIFKA
ncbi:MAG: AMP-binding protein, partial [bacterium]|nr:AMP-binding protein [bacterium]